MADAQQLLKEMKQSVGNIQRGHPQFINHFSAMAEEALKEGALPTKFKEILSTVLGMFTECPWCVATHVRNALDAGATREEITEACLVAILMGGGPAMAHTKLVFDALDDLEE
jgi:AhpD family alkylhydroperoxidase